MSSRLSHELRTPIAVVKTSLDNLSLQEDKRSQADKNNNPYIERAQTGINTLNLILTNMSEATRLEQMLSSTEKIYFDLKQIVNGCISGYQQIYPSIKFVLNIEIDDAKINTFMLHGSPEHIVQLLDKVISNGVEFSEDNIITITLKQNDDKDNNNNAELFISNNGILLPEQLSESLFDSMVSLRDKNLKNYSQKNVPHLGLGLYISRLICQFHHGKISAYNHKNPDGVTVHIRLPTKV
jgi:two-component system sensor histidine kinase ChvG